MLDWQYHPAPEYPSVQIFARAGRRFWVCPGTASWNSLFPRLDDARPNIRNLVRDGTTAVSLANDVPTRSEGERFVKDEPLSAGPRHRDGTAV